MSRKKKKEIIDVLEIDSVGFNGISIARKDGVVHQLKGAVPGDKVKALRLRKKKTYYENLLLEVLEGSEDRIEADCKYFDECGGCSWQNMPYEVQLKWKKQHIIDAFHRQYRFDGLIIEDVLASPKTYHYRNKMDFSFGASRWLRKEEMIDGEEIERKHFALGLHIPGRYDKVLDIDNCLIADTKSEKILHLVRECAYEFDISAYNNRINEGFLRSLIIRTGMKGEELVGILITNSVDNDQQIEFLKKLSEKLKESKLFTGFIYAENSTRSPVAIENSKLIFGKEEIFEVILGIKYRISPFSFFQTNSFQLDNFIGEILKIAEIKEDDTIWDLYCGTGSITLPASKYAKEIFGIELVDSSINDAKINSQINDIKNTNFYCSDLHSKDVPELLDSIPKPDKIIIDPPRAGMHKNLIEHLLKIGAPEIIYVSCNPYTQARDCDLLKDQYQIEKIKPVDMFPQTFHIESIVKLSKIN